MITDQCEMGWAKPMRKERIITGRGDSEIWFHEQYGLPLFRERNLQVEFSPAPTSDMALSDRFLHQNSLSIHRVR